jgi:GNAT superfamily N-acetyltransferase
VKEVRFPKGFRIERLRREHPRNKFRCGQAMVDQWLATKALQQQTKRLSTTKVLLDETGMIAGYYTLSPGQVEFGDLPSELVLRLPHRLLPVAMLAWFGIDSTRQAQGLGSRLLAQALRDCWESGQTFPFIAVVLDCLDERAKSFYQKYDFDELPGQPFRLFMSTQQLDAMMRGG